MEALGRWIAWMVSVAVNGFVVYLWVVFGLAAAATSQGAQVRIFIWSTIVGAGIPLLLSLYYASRAKFGVAIPIIFLAMPFIFVLTPLLARFLSTGAT